MHIYNVPIIQSDLRHEETIIQAINSLEYLQNVITSVFKQINTRIERNTQRIASINNRITKANTQVENLIGINKAINIFSSPKYPAGNLENIGVTFVIDNIKCDDEKGSINNNWIIKNSLDPVSHKNVHSKLQFYHVKGKDEPKIKMNKILSPPVGLGKLPLNIQSVNSLLIFNTNQNPYECYNQIDPLLNKDKVKQNSNTLSNRNELDAAPFSITHRKSLAQKQDFLLYTPNVRDAPELDLPVDLPDLPGVVDDVVFNMSESDIVIRPSRRDGVRTPDFLDTSPDSSSSQVVPPPDIPEEVLSAVKESNNVVHPPPPPPPPPMALPELIPNKEDNNNNKTEIPIKANSPGTDMRSDLMKAIRMAGGRTSRVTIDELVVPNTSTKVEKPKQTASPGDLMSDLHNKLAARRKGISGLQQENNVASSISSMIPAPTIKLNSSQSNTEASDEDWD